jgi:quercetin dioxygenase-like cupin family protein
MNLTRWDKGTAPSPDSLRATLTGEGYKVSEWVDTPGTVYPVHAHDYLEVRWVIRGHLRVGMPESGDEVTLNPGDRLEVPPEEPHWVDVTSQTPVVYLIGIKSRNGQRHP